MSWPPCCPSVCSGPLHDRRMVLHCICGNAWVQVAGGCDSADGSGMSTYLPPNKAPGGLEEAAELTLRWTVVDADATARRMRESTATANRTPLPPLRACAAAAWGDRLFSSAARSQVGPARVWRSTPRTHQRVGETLHTQLANRLRRAAKAVAVRLARSAMSLLHANAATGRVGKA